MYDTCVSAIKEKNLQAAIQELNGMTPEPMNSMLDKQPRQEAIDKRNKRKSMVVEDVPSTMPGTWHQSSFIYQNKSIYSQS